MLGQRQSHRCRLLDQAASLAACGSYRTYRSHMPGNGASHADQLLPLEI